MPNEPNEPNVPNEPSEPNEDEWKGKVVYSNRVGFSQRTDETFRDRLHPEHHKPE